jgi:hypothetical protein
MVVPHHAHLMQEEGRWDAVWVLLEEGRSHVVASAIESATIQGALKDFQVGPRERGSNVMVDKLLGLADDGCDDGGREVVTSVPDLSCVLQARQQAAALKEMESLLDADDTQPSEVSKSSTPYDPPATRADT